MEITWAVFLMCINMQTTTFCGVHHPERVGICVEEMVECQLDGETMFYCADPWETQKEMYFNYELCEKVRP